MRRIVVDDDLLILNPEEELGVLWLIQKIEKPLIVLRLPHFRWDKLTKVLLKLVHHPNKS
jgi:hypothetical protein